MEGFFDQLSSFQVLMDLLFVNEMYDKVLDVYKSIQEKQLQIAKFPKGVMMLVFASCYKLVRFYFSIGLVLVVFFLYILNY